MLFNAVIDDLVLKLIFAARLTSKPEERGYTVYQFADRWIVQKDKGSAALTTSNFESLSKEQHQYISTHEPVAVWLLHSHPWDSHPSPSSLDLDTLERFKDFYECPVRAIVVGNEGVRDYSIGIFSAVVLQVVPFQDLKRFVNVNYVPSDKTETPYLIGLLVLATPADAKDLYSIFIPKLSLTYMVGVILDKNWESEKAITIPVEEVYTREVRNETPGS